MIKFLEELLIHLSILKLTFVMLLILRVEQNRFLSILELILNWLLLITLFISNHLGVIKFINKYGEMFLIFQILLGVLVWTNALIKKEKLDDNLLNLVVFGDINLTLHCGIILFIIIMQ